MKSAVIAFAFSIPWKIKPNIILAEIASRKAQNFNIPIYTQKDIFINPKLEPVYIQDLLNGPPSTLQISFWANYWAQKEKIEKFYVVAARPHIERCLRDLKYVAKKKSLEIEFCVCKEVYQHSEEVWYCLRSEQKHTQTKINWQKRERIIRLLPMWFYKSIST